MISGQTTTKLFLKISEAQNTAAQQGKVQQILNASRKGPSLSLLGSDKKFMSPTSPVHTFLRSQRLKAAPICVAALAVNLLVSSSDSEKKLLWQMLTLEFINRLLGSQFKARNIGLWTN